MARLIIAQHGRWPVWAAATALLLALFLPAAVYLSLGAAQAAEGSAPVKPLSSMRHVVAADAAASVSAQLLCPPATAQAAVGEAGGTAAAAPLPTWKNSPHAAATNYTPSLTPRELEKGLVSLGDRSRARRVADKLLRGDPISVAFFGGSITAGTGASEESHKYVTHVLTWINQTFVRPQQQPPHTLQNRGAGAVPSSYFSLCCNKEAPQDVDLVVLEFNINDGHATNDHPIRHAHERLVRKLLRFPNRPAVAELLFFPYLHPNMDEHNFPVPFRWSGHDEIAALAEYYKLPVLSMRSLIWDGWSQAQAVPAAERTPGKFDHFWLVNKEGSQDNFHPGDDGHRWLAELIIHWLTRTLDDVLLHPLEAEDEEEVQRPLLRPMHKGNWDAPGNSTCIMGQEIKELVTAHDPPWVWVDEGKPGMPKWGWVSREPGSSLTLQVNTIVNIQAPEANVTLGIVHLRSYEHMGKFSIECVSGCTCVAITVEGHILGHTSQMNFASMVASASDACQLKVTVLPDTQSGEHKVKLLGVVMSEDPTGYMVNELPETRIYTMDAMVR